MVVLQIRICQRAKAADQSQKS